MYKKALINLTAITMAMSLAFSPAVTTFAAEGAAPAEQEVPATPAEVQETPAVPEGETESGVQKIVRDENDRTSLEVSEGVVEVEGSIVTEEGTKGALVVENGAAAIVNDPDEGATPGVISGVISGITANDGSTVVVYGDVTASGYESTDEMSAGEANGTGRSGHKQGSAILTDGTSDVYIDGDAIGYSDGILINPEVNAKGGRIVVTGTIGSIDEHIHSVHPKIIGLVETHDGNDFGQAGETEAEIGANVVNAFPNIYAYAYENQAFGLTYSTKGQNTDTIYRSYVQRQIDEKVHFIIHTDEATKEHFTISGYDEDLMEDFNLMSFSIDSAIKVAADAGYAISAGDNVTVIDNGDGTYNIKFKNYKGGITISAYLKPVYTPSPAVEANNSEAPVQVTAPAENATEVSEVNPFDMPFIFATLTVTRDSDLPDVLGASREDGTSNEVVSGKKVVKVAAGELSAIQYKRAFIDGVKNAPQGAVIRLETSKVTCLDKMMLTELAKRPDLTLQVAFPVNDEHVEVTVPAGYDVLSLLDENGYCGFLYLNSVFASNAQ